jgi:hypothetical protein
VDGVALARFTEKQSPPFLRPAWKVLFTHQFRIDLAQIQNVLNSTTLRRWTRGRLAEFRHELDNHPEGTAYFFYAIGLHAWASGQDRQDAAPDREEQVRAFRGAGDILFETVNRPMLFDLRADCYDSAAAAYLMASRTLERGDEYDRLRKRAGECAAERFRRFGMPSKERLVTLMLAASGGGESAIAGAYLDELERLDKTDPQVAFRRAQLAEKAHDPITAKREASAVLRAKEGAYSRAFQGEADRILSWANGELRKLELYETLPPPRRAD